MLKCQIALAVAGALSLGLGHARSSEGAAIGPWTKVCENSACVLEQTRAMTDAPPVRITMTVSRRGGGIDVRFRTSPIAEPRLRLRSENQRVMFLTDPVCDEAGCDFVTSFDGEALDGLRDARRVEATVRTSESAGAALVFDLSRLTEALGQLP